MRNGLLRVCGGSFVALAAFVAFSASGKAPSHRALAEPGGLNPGQGFLAFSSPIDQAREFLYLVDPVQQRLCVYRINFDGKDEIVSLAAVRHFAADLQLSEFNTVPSVANLGRILGQTPKRK